MTYIQELEKQNAELQERLAEAERTIEQYKAKVQLETDKKPYDPPENETINGWRLHTIVQSPVANRILFTLIKYKKGWFGKKTSSIRSFEARCKETSSTNFCVNYYTYPNHEHIYVSSEQEFHDSFFNIARQSGFILIGFNSQQNFEVKDHRIVERNKVKYIRYLKDGFICYKETDS
jgi:hypothetical protein